MVSTTDAAAALPIIQAWQGTAGDQTAVHRFVGAGALTLDVSRALVSAPRIGVIQDGNETIAFNNLNAAGIPDSTGASWSSSSPDFLTEEDIEGPTTTNDADGILFATGGLTRYCYVAAMHYNTTMHSDEVVQEVRSWLSGTTLDHAFMQCEAARLVENAVGGLFLTNAGLDDDGAATTAPTIRVPSHPLTQMDGTFEVDSGAVDSMKAKPGGYKPGVTTLINDSAATLLERITLMTGRLDGSATKGQVTYLAGHDYALDLPISGNPQTNGVRLFLNSIFESDCATDAGQADISLTKSAPALINTSTINYTINYSNPGPRVAENIKLTDKLPAGATYVAGSGVPAPSSNTAGVLTWFLPSLASGGMGTVTFQVSVTSDQTYVNTAQMSYSHITVRQVTSAPVTTTRDTVPPTVMIISGPSGVTNDSTPTFSFTAGADAVSTECHIDGDPFVPCSPSPGSFTSAQLAEGMHTFAVRATDAAGNSATASRSFTVDTEAPIVSIPVPPNQTTFNTSHPTFVFFDVGPAGTSTTAQCRIDSDALVPCVSPWQTGSPLTDGPHTLTVRITDAAGNVGQGSLVFVVDTVAPIVNIPGPPTNENPTSNHTPSLFFDVTNSPPTTAIVSVQCRFDSDAFANGTSPYTAPHSLNDGAHTFQVVATDAAGNVGSDVFIFTVGNPNGCTVCHKHTTSLTLPCNSLEYRRHLDHGDTPGACPNN